MKRTILYTLCTAMLCVALCGCADQSQGSDDMVVGTPVVPEMTPMVSPMPTPDPKDGYVEDKDGIIEENETGRDEGKSGKTNSGKSVVNPSPEVTSKP